MKAKLRTLTAIVGMVGFVLAGGSAFGLEIEFNVDGGPVELTIEDNKANDLNNTKGVIDFVETIGTLEADGRLATFSGSIGDRVTLTARRECVGGRKDGKPCDDSYDNCSTLPDSCDCPANNMGPGTCGAGGEEATFHNTDVAPHPVVVTVRSTFANRGPPLGWRVLYEGAFANDDGLDDDVEITPNDVALHINGDGTPLASLSAPVTPPVSPGGQPVEISEAAPFGADEFEVASSIQMVWTFTAGADDVIRLSDTSTGDTVGLTGVVVNQRAKCIFQMNKDGSKLAKDAGSDDVRCINSQVGDGGGDATACVDDPATLKTARAEAKLLAHFDTFCPLVPTVAVCDSGECIAGAAAGAENDLAHDLFGATVVASSDPAEGKCQVAVAKELLKRMGNHWKEFAYCKRLNISALASDTDLVSLCGASLPGNVEQRIENALTRKCAGVTVASAFPGDCASAGDFAACLVERANCRYCQGINVADAIDSGLLDCDAFDDGNGGNGSCTTPGPTTTTTTTTLPSGSCTTPGDPCGSCGTGFCMPLCDAMHSCALTCMNVSGGPDGCTSDGDCAPGTYCAVAGVCTADCGGPSGCFALCP